MPERDGCYPKNSVTRGWTTDQFGRRVSPEGVTYCKDSGPFQVPYDEEASNLEGGTGPRNEMPGDGGSHPHEGSLTNNFGHRE